ncbi:Ig-like domain-containing protein, partial [Pseudomonas nitroreducens]
MNFAYLLDNEGLYFYPLNAMEELTAPIQATEGARFVLTDLGSEQISEVVAAERVNNDLVVRLRADSATSSTVQIKDFYQFHSGLYSLNDKGDYRLHLSADSNVAQGPVALVSENLGAQQDQPEAAALNVIQQATTFQQLEAQAEQLNPQASADNAAPQAVLFDAPVAPLSAQPTISGFYDLVGSKQGYLESGNVTDDNQPEFVGTGEPGTLLEVLQNGILVGSVQVDEQGNWSYMPETELDDGGQLFFVRDPETGRTSGNLVLIIDTVAPAPAFISSVADDFAVIAKNGETRDNTPTLSGTAEANSMVAIYNGSTLVATTYANSKGAWDITLPYSLPDGTYAFRAAAIDFSGNTGLRSASYTVTIDTLPPAQPQILEAIDDFGPSTGPLVNGAGTDDATPTLKGLAEAGSRVTIYDHGQKIGEVTADNNGNWIFTPAQDLDAGGHSFTVTATDRVGNQSQQSLPWNLTVLLAAPDAPTVESVLDATGSKTGQLSSGDVTDETRPVISGKAAADSTVVIYDNGVEIGRAETDADGAWSFTPPAAMEEGEHSLTFVTINGAGNSSDPSEPWIVVIDTTPPEAPSIGGVYDDVGVKQGELARGDVTDDRQPTLSGQAEAGSLVEIFDNDVKLGETRAGDDGKWTFTPAQQLDEGEHSFTARATDAAGNLSDPSDAWDLVIDFTPPVKPPIEGEDAIIGQVIDNVGSIQGPIENGGVTDDTTPTLIGKGNPGDTIVILDNGNPIGEAQVDDKGDWTFTPKDELGEGEHAISVIVQDPAGNQSEPSDPWIVNVDSTPPEAPSIGGIYDDVGVKQGELARGDVTDDRQPTLSGQAEAGSLVEIFDKNVKLGETRADSNGNWTFTPAEELAEGEHSFTARATDAAGNPSAASEAWDLVIDVTAPEKPPIEGEDAIIGQVIDNVGSIQGPI